MTMTLLATSKRSSAVRAAVLLSAALSIATAASPALPQPGAALAGEWSAATPPAAVFTGRSENGGRVYRLPPVTISAGRSVATVETAAPKRERIRSPSARSS